MGQSLWQTSESIDFIHSSYMWIQTVLPCGKHCQTLQIGTVSWFWLCGRSWRFEIHFWRNIVRFWKSYICSNKLDVQETNQQNQKSFPWMQDWGWTVYPHLINGIWSSQFLETRITAIKNGETPTRTWFVSTPHTIQKRKKFRELIDDLDSVDFISSNVHPSRQEALLYVFEDNEAVIKMIVKGRSPTMRHVSRTHRVALDWLFDRINLDPKIQINYIDTKKPTRRHTNQGEFHTWWMESSFVFIQHLPFQLHEQRQSDSEKNTRRCRWRKIHSKIEADDEFGLAMQRKDSWRVCLYCIRKPEENQIWKSITSEFVDWTAFKNGKTCEGRLLIKLFRVECWRKMVFSRVEIWWSDGSKNGETC